jgi:phosphoribosylanthranilate isomerase
MSSVIKAVFCQTEEEIRALRNYPVAAVLMDARDAGHYGGTGKNSDWRLAIKVKETHPLILAGGLNRKNIREAIERVRPHAVDINSGVESSPGKKDPNKIREIMEIVRETTPMISGTMGNSSEHQDVFGGINIFHGNKR